MNILELDRGYTRLKQEILLERLKIQGTHTTEVSTPAAVLQNPPQETITEISKADYGQIWD